MCYTYYMLWISTEFCWDLLSADLIKLKYMFALMSHCYYCMIKRINCNIKYTSKVSKLPICNSIDIVKVWPPKSVGCVMTGGCVASNGHVDGSSSSSSSSGPSSVQPRHRAQHPPAAAWGTGEPPPAATSQTSRWHYQWC